MPSLIRLIGRRGTFLLLAGACWVYMGAFVGYTGDRINPADAILYELIPVPIRVAMWLSTGILAMLVAFLPRKQFIGFLTLIILPFERAVGNLWSFFQYILDGDPPGEIASIFGVLLWSTIFWIIFLIAGWDEDVVRPKRED